MTDFAIAMLLAADGTAAGPTLSAIAATATDPALREALPILNAYALYWSGDMRAAGDSFMSFAIANPDSRFADDALYAAAEANLQGGDEGGARRDLEALAGDGHARGRVPTLLLELEPRAVVREGMRRDRELPVRLMPRRIADLLDGDGVRLAQAALEKQARQSAGPGHRTGRRHVAPAQPSADATAGAMAAASTDRALPAGASAAAGRHDTTVPSAARDQRFPWSTLAVLVLFAVVGSYLLARRAQERTSGQQR